MTVCLAYRVGEKVVLACDGRVTDESGAIVTDSAKKWLQCGRDVVLMAGKVGDFWAKAQHRPPSSYQAFRKRLSSAELDEFDWLSYQPDNGCLQQTDTIVSEPYCGIGSGASVALGALDAMQAAETIEEAQECLKTAILIAVRRNSSCGGVPTIISL